MSTMVRAPRSARWRAAWGLGMGGVTSEGRSFGFSGGCFSAGKGRMGGLDLKFGTRSRKVEWEAEIFACC
jgi:hypothetical protein